MLSQFVLQFNLSLEIKYYLLTYPPPVPLLYLTLLQLLSMFLFVSALFLFLFEMEWFIRLRLQKDLRPHLSFSYGFRASTLQRRIRLKTLLYPQSAYSKWTRRMRLSIYRPGKLAPFSILCWRPVVSIWMTWPFSDSIVFTVHTRKQRFQKASF